MGSLSKISAIAEMTPEIKDYTEQPIPRDITDDEIDAWLAMVPDLMEFWEMQVADKKLRLEMVQQAYDMALTVAYNQADDRLAVKTRENVANADPRVVDAAKEVIQAKYEMQLVQAVFRKMEAKAHSIHKIASLRARRLETGVVAPSVRGDPSLRNNPVTVPVTNPKREKILWGKDAEKTLEEMKTVTDKGNGKNHPSKQVEDSVARDLKRELSQELDKDEVF